MIKRLGYLHILPLLFINNIKHVIKWDNVSLLTDNLKLYIMQIESINYYWNLQNYIVFFFCRLVYN